MNKRSFVGVGNPSSLGIQESVKELSTVHNVESLKTPDQRDQRESQPAKRSATKKSVDRSQFISKTKPVTGVSEPRQLKFPIRKPGSSLFFRTSDDSDAQIHVDVIEGSMGKVYVLGNGVSRDERLARLTYQARLVPCINEKGQAFVWPMKTSGREWYRSAIEVTTEAATKWVRIEADSFSQSYRMEDATIFPELATMVPKWTTSASDILDEVLDSSAITDDNDPILIGIVGKHRSVVS